MPNGLLEHRAWASRQVVLCAAAALVLTGCVAGQAPSNRAPNAMFFTSLEACASAPGFDAARCEADRALAQETLAFRPTRVIETPGAFRTWKDLAFPEPVGWLTSTPGGPAVAPQLVYGDGPEPGHRTSAWVRIPDESGAVSIPTSAMGAPTKRYFITKDGVTDDPRAAL